ncbi:MAG: hypothetical protein R3242_05165 [Akkermansiaceae bacterium]|nr:hypothetical protein [Akkermansiaceae bacterium]
MNELGTVGQTMKPGQKGTVKWKKRFGEKLALVRYRYLPNSKKRQTTVELLVEETTWIPPREQTVLVDIKWEEIDLRNQIKHAGGRWIPELKRWEISKDLAKRHGLQNRLDK